MANLLVVDDEQSICWGLRKLGESLGHEVRTASSAEQGLEQLTEFPPDVIVLDVRLPGMDGITAIREFRDRIGPVPIILITAYGDLSTAVDAVREGAFEYVIKPFELAQIERALGRALNQSEAVNPEQSTARPTAGLVGSSSAIQEVFKHIALAAASDAGVLLCGESGTGKDLAARAIHRFSNRADGPFVAVSVASLSETLAESELFGHVRGSFTGADETRTGLLVEADGGTLFLDEVADIPMAAQVKLLRALEHREVVPVGSGTPIKTNFRVISATHQNLLESVKSGTFRHDLYFRLGAYRIELPPLRQRSDDIPELAQHFLGSLASGQQTSHAFSTAAIGELKSRPWFGNVRELRNAIEHAMVVARGGVIEPEHFPESIASPMANQEDGGDSLEQRLMAAVSLWTAGRFAADPDADDLYEQLLRLIEPALFGIAIAESKGQVSAAARRLGLHRTTLKKKLDTYGISEEPP